ncbi:uncharacterized protein [Pyxicephalus adspersus]|uniref:uncharacterized protein n=1 Tax=Pyxicephalus adspersus TaxID=30357 RepID=UPI003B5A4F7B
MGGQAKSKKNSKIKKRQRKGGHDAANLSVQDRMKIKMENKAKNKTAQKYSIHQLLEKIEDYMDNFNYEMAQLFCQRALDMEPDNLDILETMGNICMELGDTDKAKQVLLRAVELSPEKGHAKYMCLGQIHCEEDALQYFHKGLTIMINTYKNQSQESGAASWPNQNEVTATDISAAFCSIAEIYLTDLCMEDGAGDKCKEAIEKALEYNPNNPESLQLMASYLFSMEKQQEGKEYLLKSLASWLPSMQKEEQELENEPDKLEAKEAAFPPYESRITTSKLLIEVEEFELAAEILEGLLEEDDEVIQVWYLLGWVC